MNIEILSAIEKVDGLLSGFPGIRSLYFEMALEARTGAKLPAAKWGRIQTFMETADRPKEERALLEQVAHANLQGERASLEDLDEVLFALERAEQEMRGYLVHRVGGTDEVVAAVLAEFAPQHAETRDERLHEVLRLIYAKPGLYLRKLHRQLQAEAKLELSYEAVRQYVRELEARDEVVTIGDHQGIPRYCFPHPSKIDRNNFLGRLYPLEGAVEQDVTALFQPKVFFVSVYLVNHHMAPVLVVAPADANLHENDEVEGFGKLRRVGELRKHLEPLGKLPAKEIVVPDFLATHGKTARRVSVPPGFVQAFA